MERLAKTEEIIAQIGTVNMRALEVYDSVKKEYDSVREKTEIISIWAHKLNPFKHLVTMSMCLIIGIKNEKNNFSKSGLGLVLFIFSL